MSAPRRLFWHALAAFLVLPGVVGFLMPWLLRPRRAVLPELWRWCYFVGAGALCLVLGTGLLLWCVRDFYVAGHGSLAPWAPPERLVTVGLYRHSRNPMYVAVLVILLGWALVFGGTTARLWYYAASVALMFQFRVVYREEPWLARRHAAEWSAYRARVPRWLPNIG